MEVVLAFLWLLLGSAGLYFGAEGLVSGSASVAIKAGIKVLVVGLTIVAFGTSSPELVISLSAALEGKGDISAGNIIGSNICNIALILGAAALIRPIDVDKKLIKTDMPIMIGITLLFIIFAMDKHFGRVEGGIFLILIVAYNFIAIYFSRKENNSEAAEEAKEAANPERRLFFDILFIAGGIVILVAGANLFLHGATDLAKILGATDAVIGLTVVALGTSLPELATSVVAAVKQEGDISIGNAIGSNIYNILLIIGATALISPITITGITNTDIGMLIFISLLIVPLAGFGLKLNRPKGVLLLTLYAGYMIYLFQ